MPRSPDFSTVIQAVDPGRVFLTTTEGAEVSYGELCSISSQFAAVFNALGIAGDDPVAILLPPGAEAIVAILATMNAAVAAPLNPALATPELLTLLQRIRPRLLIANESLDPALLSAIRHAGLLVRFVSNLPQPRLVTAQVSHVATARVSDARNATGLLLPTSGTSGEPKLVKLSHDMLLHAATQIAEALELTGADRNFCVLPCYHIHGLSTVLATVLTGGVVIAGDTSDASRFGQTLGAQKVTWLSATPAYFQAILTSRQRGGMIPTSHSLRFLRCASAPLSDTLAAALEKAFGVPLVQAYGMTEAGPHIACNGLAADARRMGSVGRPDATRVAIRPVPGLTAPERTIGEIVIRGENVIHAYFEDASEQDASAQDASSVNAAFRDGWFHTGDTGYLDADGFLFVTGRIREMINCGGEKLSPRQIESVLMEHPAVREAVVYPAPHATLGEIPHAAVVLHEGFLYADSEAAAGAQLQQILRRYCLSQLAPFKVPHVMHFVSRIPTGGSGKVRRHTLRDLLEAPTRDERDAVAGCRPLPFLRQAVTTVWADILGPGDFRDEDNFFHCGGDSLTATMAMHALERKLGVPLPADCFFLHPTVAQQAQWLARQPVQVITAPVETPRASSNERIEQVAPLFAGQRRLWFLHRAGSGSEYNMGSCLWLRGPLATDLMNRAVNALRRRHAVLRATIGVLDGSPVQRIRPYARTDLTTVDISDLPHAQRVQRALFLASEFRNQVFALDTGPLFRCQLIRLDSTEHLLVLGIHHILCDGWSMAILQRELITLYTQIVAGYPEDRLPPAVQFHEYLASTGRREPDAMQRQQQIAWWRQQLVDMDPVLHLPCSGGRAGHTSNRASHLHFTIPGAVARRLERQAGQCGATLYMLLVSALGILLHRYTRQQRFCLGTVAAGRDHADLEQTVGFLAKTLPLPIRIAETETVRAVTARCIDTVKGLFGNADLEFEDIVQACGAGRVEGVTPLFQVMFAFHNFPQQVTAGTKAVESAVDDANPSANDSSRLVVESVVVDADCAKFDLSLHMKPGDGGLTGVWQFRRDKLDAYTIAAMNRDFAAILLAILDTPAQAVALIPIGDDNLAHSPASDGDPDIAADPLPIMHQVARQAAAKSLRIAIRTNDGCLTYAELLERVNRLANYLAVRKIGPGNTVAILLPRDAAMVIAPLAVMVTGAAFVPLDGLSPVARLREMIEIARTDLLIVNSATRALLFADAGFAPHALQMVCLDESETTIAACPSRANRPPPSPDTPAYIVFTSGSTGKPKGVVISHGNLAHYARALSLELDITAADSYLHTASSAFSASIRQYVLPLVSGAEVVIADRHQIENVEKLLSLVHSMGVTILDLVPTLWRGCQRWLALSGQSRGDYSCPHLRLLLSASEPLPDALAASVCANWPHARLINMYGQTETAGIVTTYPVPGHGGPTSVAALGKPIAGHTVYLLDECARPVPAGVVGEICVSGPCVGQGYLALESPVAAPFSQPLQPDSGAVMIYRTGDLGRFREDGNLEFRGRLDAQIKYRGFRIEPDEIESVAMTHPQVTQSAVLVARGASAQSVPELQLLFCAEAGTKVGSFRAQLRAHLAQRLPSYMVPRQLIQVDAMPRTLSGKLDRGALRVPSPRRADSAAHVVPQITAQAPVPAASEAGNQDPHSIMHCLQSIWREVLLCDTVEPHDNFFDLGGNSILSIEIVSAALDAGLELTLDQVFQFQTIAELAAVARYRANAVYETDSELSANSAVAHERGPGASAEAPAVATKPAAPLARYTADSLRAFSFEALEQAGLPPAGARIVTEVQLESSLRGQATHNVADIPRYARRLAAGVLNANPEITTVETSAISATVDGDNGPGQWVATLAIDSAIALARRSGAGIVSVRRSNHFGAAGHYAWRASLAGMIGLCFTNGPVVLAPTGGVTPLFGNNPLAIGLPRGDGHPVVLDIAMSVATRGKIGLNVAEGKPLEAGWILDKLGLPTTQLADLAAGLAAPIGGHKGYGLALAIEILAGALTGAGYCRDHAQEASGRHGGFDTGHFFIAFDPQLFIGRDAFEARVADIVRQVKSSELAAGSAEIVVPGEVEFRTREESLRLGVPLQASVVRRLTDYGERHGLGARLRRVSQE